ncbi:MarR family winged helix-turn-helix transcriptional regulator [Roseospira visakhapatnamensis]|uniref:DNA-binding MarR family transcriptional regulator n=1 Tax=Roseospira visakhapatnamensis TaxID=390880 RepID=A0A7W6REP9_9PROT|nr:MarR family winged helix-turn-helix transcriptional regulator [Roseospira visakhapatnamensis]MBB4266937.1 DNA-binding MarR family transcriptional regulator [Roseospira visakhapatnamensis]
MTTQDPIPPDAPHPRCDACATGQPAPTAPDPPSGAAGTTDGEDAGAARVLRLETFLPYRLSVLANTISHAVALAYRDRFGLGVAEWRVMATLGERSAAPPSPAETPPCANTVAARTAMDKVQVSRAIARMITAGLVSRAPDPHDRRRAILSLTPEGRAIYERIVPAALDYEQRLMALLTDSERACLSRLIDKLMTNARSVEGATPADLTPPR